MRPVLLAVLFALASSAEAQPAPAPDSLWAPPARSEALKDPQLASLISLLVPGGGHLYAGETETGVLLLGLSVGAPLAGMYYTLSTCEPDGFIGCSNEVSLTPLLVGLGVGLGAQIYGVADAGSAARRANRRAGHAWTLHPTLVPSQQGAQTGLALSTRF